MKTRTTWALGLLVSAVMLMSTSCVKDDLNVEPDLKMTAAKSQKTTLEDQLKQVKRAVMRFHSFEQAKMAGYAEAYPFNPSPYIPHMGFHYINVGLIDGKFDMEHPEILLYVPNEQGQLKLVGVEYAVPTAITSTPPEGFIGDSDHWHVNPNVAGGSWTLHAWLVEENPDGVFAELNPNIPVSDPSL